MKFNFKRIALAVVAEQALGMLWYSPFLFVNPWIAAQGKKAGDIDMSNPIPFVYSWAASIGFCFCVSQILASDDCEKLPKPVKGALTGAMLAVMTIIPAVATHYGFLGLSGTLIAIDTAKELVAGALAGAIIAPGITRKA